MPPRDEAEELINMYRGIVKAEYDVQNAAYDLQQYERDARDCALVHANKMLETLNRLPTTGLSEIIEHWREVKREIEKL